MPNGAEIIRCRAERGPKANICFIRIAEEKWYSRLTSNAKRNFSEMGLVQISVVAFNNKSGNLNIDM